MSLQRAEVDSDGFGPGLDDGFNQDLGYNPDWPNQLIQAELLQVNQESQLNKGAQNPQNWPDLECQNGLSPADGTDQENMPSVVVLPGSTTGEVTWQTILGLNLGLQPAVLLKPTQGKGVMVLDEGDSRVIFDAYSHKDHANFLPLISSAPPGSLTNIEQILQSTSDLGNLAIFEALTALSAAQVSQRSIPLSVKNYPPPIILQG